MKSGSKILFKILLALAIVSIALLNVRVISNADRYLGFSSTEKSFADKSLIAAQPLQPQTSKPKFFLHIGPHKSATTSIQCALHEAREVLRRQDGIEFLGKADLNFCDGPKKDNAKQDPRFKGFNTCILESDKEDNRSCWKNVSQTFRDYRDAGGGTTTLVLSKESLSAFTSTRHSDEEDRTIFWDRVAESLRGWNVTVVMAYRRYFEWLPSAKFQQDYHHYLQSMRSWPSEPIPSLVSYVEHLLENSNTKHPYPYVDVMKDFTYPKGWNVHLLDLHRDDGIDIVQDLLCNVLQANAACEQYHPSSPKRTSPSKALAYHSLNTQAKLMGWFSGDGGRPFQKMQLTMRQVETIWNMTLSDLPHVCLEQKRMEKLLSISLLYERRFHQVSARQTSTNGSSSFSQQFWKFARRNYCVVDAEKVLLQEEVGNDYSSSSSSSRWRNFYNESFSI